MRGAAGVEFPGIVLIGDSLYAEYTRPDLAVTAAHEVAHQWWYNLVGNDVIDDPWLDEALTTYSSSLYYEFTQGASAAEILFSHYENRYQQAVDAGADDQITRSETYFENLENPGRYGAIVYAKGMLFFRALRREIGDEAFFSALAQYFNNYKYQIARPDNLLNTFEEAAGRQLDDFYQDWLYSPD
jgi:aminopeptidase N